MTEDHTNELTERAEAKKAIALKPKEVDALSVLLNIELRKVSMEWDFAGRRTDPTLTQKEALPLNEVYKQLAGRDHDQYEKMFGSTMLATDKSVKSNIIHIGDNERTAVLRLVNWELNHYGPTGRKVRLGDKYEKTLLNLQQKINDSKSASAS